MRALIIAVLLTATVHGQDTYDAALAAKLKADENGMKVYVMAFLKAGPNRDRPREEAQKLQAAHRANINRLAKEGKLVLAGPFADDGVLRGIYIFDVATVAEAEALTKTDPAIQAGQLVVHLEQAGARLVEQHGLAGERHGRVGQLPEPRRQRVQFAPLRLGIAAARSPRGAPRVVHGVHLPHRRHELRADRAPQGVARLPERSRLFGQVLQLAHPPGELGHPRHQPEHACRLRRCRRGGGGGAGGRDRGCGGRILARRGGDRPLDRVDLVQQRSLGLAVGSAAKREEPLQHVAPDRGQVQLGRQPVASRRQVRRHRTGRGGGDLTLHRVEVRPKLDDALRNGRRDLLDPPATPRLRRRGSGVRGGAGGWRSGGPVAARWR